MKISQSLIIKFIRLCDGETLPSSGLKGDWIDEMLQDGILVTTTHGRNRSLHVVDKRTFEDYIAGKYSIRDLRQTLGLLSENEQSRASQVAVSGDSKFTHQRTFKGFLVNCYAPVSAAVCGKAVVIKPVEGTYTFIYDYDGFRIPSDVLIVGIENSENFRHIVRQRYLFESQYPGQTILFVSRYPQTGDLIKWLQMITNKYVHFGDLDLAGVQIYLNEFHRYLGSRSSFLIPEDYEQRISKGSMQRYTVQYERCKNMKVDDPNVIPLLDCIHKYHRGYDQEGFILV